MTAFLCRSGSIDPFIALIITVPKGNKMFNTGFRGLIVLKRSQYRHPFTIKKLLGLHIGTRTALNAKEVVLSRGMFTITTLKSPLSSYNLWKLNAKACCYGPDALPAIGKGFLSRCWLIPPKGHVPSTAIALNHPPFGPVLPGISNLLASFSWLWIPTIGIIHLTIGVMADDMSISKSNDQHPVPTTPRSVSRAMVKDSTSHRIASIKFLLKDTPSSITVKGSLNKIR
jgi:hypothetical protein